MKIIKYTIIIAAMSLISCNDDFLERSPLDEVINEIFWNNENDIINYNNNLYEIAKDDRTVPILMGLGPGPGVLFEHGLWWMDEMSDNLGATHPRAWNLVKVSTGNFNVENTARPFGYHDEGWEFVRAINFGLENYDRVPIDENIIDQYRGEARLFRGWFYADKVSKFGDMQWIDKTLKEDSPELFGTRDDRDFVMQKVLEDLNFAIANLPAEWGIPNEDQDPGRVDKWVALAVKSRVCLFEGTWRKYHGLSGADPWLEESVAASTELMNTGGFSLYNTGNPMGDYRYASSSTTQAGNPEVIYWRKYEALINGHFASRLFWNYNGGATKSFVDDFLCDDGLPIALSPNYAGDAEIEDVFVNRDLRLRQCVLAPADQELLEYANDPANTYPRLNGMTGGRNRSNTGYHVVKHWNAVDELSPRDQHTVSPPCLRLGEIFLNYAEAKAELGTINQGDLDISINLLRDRVGMPGLNINPPMDPAHADDGVSSLIVEIRRERRVELFLEAHRYDDLRRWKQGKYLAAPTLGMRFDAAAQARYPGANVQTTLVDGVPYIDVRTGTPFEPKFEDRMYLWPLPTNALSENPNLGQNPGW